MRPLVRPFTDPAGGQWFVVSGRFPTQALGAAGYQFVMEHTRQRGDLGVYRHGEPDEGGVLVSAVSIKRPEVLRVARLLGNRGAADEELHPTVTERLAIRRARVIVEADEANMPSGRIKIRHPGRGAYLEMDGSMSDDKPMGQG